MNTHLWIPIFNYTIMRVRERIFSMQAELRKWNMYLDKLEQFRDTL